MPITAPIPLPEAPGDALVSGTEWMNKLLAAPIDRQKAQAEAQHQQALARQANYISDLFGRYLGAGGSSSAPGGGQGFGENNKSSADQSIGQPQQGKLSQGSSSLPLLLAAALKMPTHEVNGQIVTPFGNVQVGPSDFQKKLNEQDTKRYGEWQNQVQSGVETQTALNNMKELSISPVAVSMKQNPELMGKDMLWYKIKGTSEQKEWIGEFRTNLKNGVQNFIKGFKGAAREFENKLAQEGYPQDTDPLELMQAKANLVANLNQISTERLDLASNIYRSSQGEISPANAMKIAEKQLGSDKRLRELKEDFNQKRKDIVERSKLSNAQNAQNSSNNTNSNSEKPISILYHKDKEGRIREVHIDPKLVQQALAEGAKLTREELEGGT